MKKVSVSVGSAAAVQPDKQSARERLLAAAEALFYEEGFNTVGIDRVIERAGVAKASLYACFGSKEELVRAYLLSRHEARKRRVETGLARYDNPRDRLLGMFDIMGNMFAEPTYRGCAFVKAGADAKIGSSARAVCEETRDWLRDMFVDLAREAGASDPRALTQQLVMLYDGAAVSAQMDRQPGAAAAARVVAAAMLDASVKAGGVARSGRRNVPAE